MKPRYHTGFLCFFSFPNLIHLSYPQFLLILVNFIKPCSIIKILLVVSKEEQKEHFLSRLEDPTKYWKFDPSDLEARARWDDYMAAWQDVFARTSTEQAPWYLVPADNRWYSRAVVSELLRNTLKNMNMIWPPLEVDADEMRRQLETL